MTSSSNKYNLEERTSIFGEDVIIFCNQFPRKPLVIPLLSQLIRSATSIGANYMEANWRKNCIPQ